MPQRFVVGADELEEPGERVSVRVTSGAVDIPSRPGPSIVDVSELEPDVPPPPAPTPARPSLLTQIRAGLEPRESEGLLTRIPKAVGRGLVGVVTAPWEVVKAGWQTPETPEEEIASVMPGGLLAYRLVTRPAQETLSNAIENFKQGNYVRGAVGAAASAVPVVGPQVDTLAERAARGDVAGAITEGLTVGLLPLGVKGAFKGARAALSSKPGLRVLAGSPERMVEPLPGGPAASTGTRSDVAQFAHERGIELLPGQATEARPLRAIQSVGERSLAGEPVQRHLEGQRARLAEEVEAVKDRMASREAFPGREEIGTELQNQVLDKMNVLKEEAKLLYDDWTARTGDVKIDTSELQTKWGKRRKQFEVALQNTPARYAKPIGEILDKAARFGREVMTSELQDEVMIGGRKMKLAELSPEMRQAAMAGAPPAAAKLVKKILPEMTTSDMSQLRTAFWEVAHDYSGNIPKRVNAIAAEIVQDLDALMSGAAQKTGTYQIWRAANDKWKELETDFDTPSSPLYRVLKEKDVSKVPQRLASRGEIGGTPRAVQMARAQGVDLRPLKRQVVQDIHEANFALGPHGGQRLGGYSHEFLAELFTPEELRELYLLGRTARAIRYEMNPSGTSDVMSALQEIGAVPTMNIRKLSLGPAAARFTLDPKIREAVTGIQPGESSAPPPPPAAGGLAVPKFPSAAAIGTEPANRLLRQVRATGQGPAAQKEPEKKTGPLSWMKEKWDRMQALRGLPLEEQIRIAEGEPTGYERWIGSEVLPQKPVRIPGAEEFEAATKGRLPVQGAADWMNEVARQLNTKGMALSELVGRAGTPFIRWQGKRKAWTVDKLEPPPEGEPRNARILPGEELALDRMNRALKRDPEAGAPTHRATIVRNPETGETLHLGKITPKEWIGDRLTAFKTPEELAAARDWYRKLLKLFEDHYGPDQAEAELLHWALSQQQASPSQGLMNVFRASDIHSGFQRIKKAGLSEAAMLAAMGGKTPTSGVAQKLNDFSDATKGKTTRSYYGDDPRMGSPAPIDVHSGRDVGYIDQALINRVREVYGPKEARRLHVTQKNNAAPSELQYEWGNRFYNDVTAELNRQGVAGGNWKPAETQAVGWVAIQKKLGMKPESPEDIFLKNYRQIPTEFAFGEDTSLARVFPPLYKLDLPRAQAITREALDPTVDELAKMHNVRVVRAPTLTGGYTEVSEKKGVAPVVYPPTASKVVLALGSPESLDAFTASLGWVGRQREMIAVRKLDSGRTHAMRFETADGSELTSGQISALGHLIQAGSPVKAGLPTVRGFTALPSLTGVVVYRHKGNFTAAEMAQIRGIADNWGKSDNVNLAGVDFHADVKRHFNDWTKDPEGRGHLVALGRTGRSHLQGALRDSYGRLLQRADAAYRKHAAAELEAFRKENPLDLETAKLLALPEAPAGSAPARPPLAEQVAASAAPMTRRGPPRNRLKADMEKK